MLPISIAFTMTDAVAAQAARELWISLAKRLFTPGLLGLTALVALLFGLALKSHAAWPWLLLTGASPAIFLLLVLGWVAGFWWTQRVVTRRLSHLPHRDVVVELADAHLGFQTATERLQVGWTELKAVKALPSYWVLVLKAGAQIPVPRAVMSSSALAMLQGLAPTGCLPAGGRLDTGFG